eukprot:8345299-Alexandrium_andersonii.AAC.1
MSNSSNPPAASPAAPRPACPARWRRRSCCSKGGSRRTSRCAGPHLGVAKQAQEAPGQPVASRLLAEPPA